MIDVKLIGGVTGRKQVRKNNHKYKYKNNKNIKYK